MSSLQIKKTKISWSWKDAVAKWDRQRIFEDLLKEDSTIFTMAKDDVVKIFLKTDNYAWIIRKTNFNDIYPLGLDITKMQIKNYLANKKSFLVCNNCDYTNLQIVKKIVSRIVNNIKNLFDKRYKTCISAELRQMNYDILDTLVDENDALNILIQEEDQIEYDSLIEKLDREYIETIATMVKIEQNQMCLDFGS